MSESVLGSLHTQPRTPQNTNARADTRPVSCGWPRQWQQQQQGLRTLFRSPRANTKFATATTLCNGPPTHPNRKKKKKHQQKNEKRRKESKQQSKAKQARLKTDTFLEVEVPACRGTLRPVRVRVGLSDTVKNLSQRPPPAQASFQGRLLATLV